MNEAGLKQLPAGIHTRRLDVSSENDCQEFVAWAAEKMARAQRAGEQRGHPARWAAGEEGQDDRSGDQALDGRLERGDRDQPHWCDPDGAREVVARMVELQSRPG